MAEFQPSSRSSDLRQRNSTHLVTPGDGMKRDPPATQARRRALLQDAAIITVGCVICVVAICIIFGRTLPTLTDAARMVSWPSGTI